MAVVDELCVAVDTDADECRKLLIVVTVIGSWLPRCVANGTVDEPHVFVDVDVDEKSKLEGQTRICGRSLTSEVSIAGSSGG